MGLQMGRIDHQPARLASLARQLGENLIEHAETAPAHKPVVDGLVWTVVARGIAPAKPIPNDENDPADYPPVIKPGNAMRQRENCSIRRICASDSRNKSSVTAPPCAASESIDHLIRKIFIGF